nr:hypothetical protein [uncultured Anaerocolumna sp.]
MSELIPITYYKNNYLLGRKQVLDDASYNYYIMQATKTIDIPTFGRVDWNNPIDSAKMCACELAELIYRQDKDTRKENIQSEKVGGHSVTYADKTVSEQTFNRKTNAIISKWLGNTNLLYRGLC